MTGTTTPPAEGAPVLLEVRNLSAHHGQLPAVRDVSLSLRAPASVAIHAPSTPNWLFELSYDCEVPNSRQER